MSTRDYHKWWLGIIALAVVVEAIALRRTGAGDTLSEWVWSKISQWPLRATVAALLCWLAGPGRLGKGAVWALDRVARVRLPLLMVTP